LKTKLKCVLGSGFGAIYTEDLDSRLDIHILYSYETVCDENIREQVIYLLSLVSNTEIPKYIE